MTRTLCWMWGQAQTWWRVQMAMREADSARTWPRRGDVWLGLGERVEVRQARAMVGGRAGVDLMLTRGAEVSCLVWAPYDEFARSTRGMSLVRREPVEPVHESRLTAAGALGAFVGGMAGLWAVWSLWGQ